MQNNLILTNEQDTYFKDHALIKPPEISASDIPKRYHRYVIDSRDRNLHHYINPNKYTIKLSEDVHDVQSVELISFDVPFTEYLINDNNNTFHYSIDGVVKTIKISTGDYSSRDDFIQQLNTSSDLDFTCNPLNNKITVTKKIDIVGDIILLCTGLGERKNDYEATASFA